MEIVWDEPKRLKNLAERGLDFADITPEFFEGSLVMPARLGRYRAIGWFEDRPLAVIFRPLGTEGLSVISMRRASRAERRLL